MDNDKKNKKNFKSRGILFRNIFVPIVFMFVLVMGCFFAISSNKSYAIDTLNIPTQVYDKLVSKSGGFKNYLEDLNIKPYYGSPSGNSGEQFDFFCLNKNMKWENNYTFALNGSSSSTAKLPYPYVVIMTQDVDGFSFSGSEALDKERYFRQLALWLYEYETSSSDFSGCDVDTSDYNDTQLKNYYTKCKNYISQSDLSYIKNTTATDGINYYSRFMAPLINKAKTATDPLVTPPVVNLSSDITWSIVGDNLVSSDIYVSGNSLNSYSVSLPSNLSDAKIIVSGSIVTSTSKINIGYPFKISIPLNSISNNEVNFNINVDSSYEAFEAYRYTPQSGQTGYQLVQDIVTFIKKTNTVNTSLGITIPTGVIKVAKVSKGNVSVDGSNIPGAQLCIVKSTESDCSNAIYSFTSTTGVSNFTLVPGSYRVIEQTPPSGYLPSNDSYVFDVDSNGNVSPQEVDVENTPIVVRIKKVDKKTGLPIAGAKIAIYKVEADGTRNYINSFISTDTDTGVYAYNQDGSPLSNGDYVAIEVTAPEGYFLDNSENPFVINNNTSDVVVTLEDNVNELSIVKYDQDNKVLDGASFIINKSAVTEDNPLYSCVSGSSDNPCSFKMIPSGVYYIHETQAPLGYKKSDEVKKVVITNETKERISFSFVNVKKGIKILKVDENNNPVSGAKLVLNTSSNVCTLNTCVPYNNDQTYSWTSTNDSKDISNLPPGVYYVHEVKAPDGYVLDKTPKKIEILEGDTTKLFTFSNNKTRISILKKDKSGKCVSGAKLAIYKGSYNPSSSNNNLVSSWTSQCDANGDFISHDITGLYGDYVLVEESAPSGYYASGTPVSFKVDEDTQNLSISMVNEKKTIFIKKIDKSCTNSSKDTCDSIVGATLALYNADTNEQVGSSWVTEANPREFSNLPNGKYYIKEISAPLGYIKSDKNVYFTVDDNTTTEVVTFENEKIVLRLSKIDASTGKNISGATLKLSKKDGSIEPIIFVSTDSDVEISGPNITPGIYILEEVQAPSGYVSSSSKIEFEVFSTGKVQTKSLISNNISLSIKNKSLIIDSNKIPGFKFKVFDASTDKEVLLIELSDQVYTSDPLSNGEYYIKEVEVPDGYILNNNRFNFFIDDSGNNRTITFSNDFTKVIISKKDITNGQEIAGAHLELKDKDGNVIEEWTSDFQEHLIERTLKAGEVYYLKETIAPSGYELSSSEIVFTVGDTGVVKMVTMNNTPYFDTPNTLKNTLPILFIVGLIIISLGGTILFVSYNKKGNV